MIFKNTPQFRQLLKNKGFTAPPSIETDRLKLWGSLESLIDAWHDETEIRIGDVRELNDALRENFHEREEKER